MAKVDYSVLDAVLLEGIGAGVNTFSALCDFRATPQAQSILEVAKDLAQPDRWNVRDGGRLVDRRLQALRKAGKIKSSRGQWLLLSPAKQAGDPSLREISVRSRHLEDYLLINRRDGTAWQPVVHGDEVTWKAVDPAPRYVAEAGSEQGMQDANGTVGK